MCLNFLINSWPAWLMLGMESHYRDLGMNSHSFLFLHQFFFEENKKNMLNKIKNVARLRGYNLDQDRIHTYVGTCDIFSLD